MLISLSAGHSGLQTKMVLSICNVFLTAVLKAERLKCDLQHILSDSKLLLFQRTKATKFVSELTLHFPQSQEVRKNISS